MPPYIAASLLAANLTKIGSEAVQVLQAGADLIHFDVMDNHFVPNLSFGADLLRDLREMGITAKIDVHLMLTPLSSDTIDSFIKAGASAIIFHAETAAAQVYQLLTYIKKHEIKCGLALSPNKQLEEIEEFLPYIDKLLIMSVEPGFSGQVFIPETMQKIKAAKQLINQYKLQKIDLIVDGGINQDNIQELSKIGVTTFVIGNSIFASRNYQQTIAELKGKL